MVGQMIPWWKREFGVMKWHQTRKPKQRTILHEKSQNKKLSKPNLRIGCTFHPTISDMKGWPYNPGPTCSLEEVGQLKFHDFILGRDNSTVYIYIWKICMYIKTIHVYETNYQAIALIIHVLVLVVFINTFFSPGDPSSNQKDSVGIPQHIIYINRYTVRI